MTEYTFKPMTWTDNEDGGSVGSFHGKKVYIEVHGKNADRTFWGVFDNPNENGCLRGGRDGERTLDDIKRLVEEEERDRAIRRYENAKIDIVLFESQHMAKSSNYYYVVSDYSHTDLRKLWKVETRPLRRESDAETFADMLTEQEQDKPPSKRHTFAVVRSPVEI